MFSTAISITTIIALVAAVPTTPSYYKVAAEIPENLPPIQGLSIFVQGGESLDKRDLEKRASLTVDIWAEPDKGGRHESLRIQTNNCCMQLNFRR